MRALASPYAKKAVGMCQRVKLRQHTVAPSTSNDVTFKLKVNGIRL